jgi:Reverse transcriptase (RNA-dependent DNA polymerase)
LGINANELLELFENADRYYIPLKPIIKPNGDLRQVFDTKPFLKKIHGRILQQIFYKVYYPPYLQGSIKDNEHPRDYITDCKKHGGQKIVFSEDISDFFPSIRSEYVFRMWKFLFNFPDDVAVILTELTTHQGFVPQGAKTSSYIANLILWEAEPQLEEKLRKRGFVYTRYVDDITVSTNRYITNVDKTFVTSLIYKMLSSVGVKANRRKRKVVTNSKRMAVHNVNVNWRKPTLEKKERSNIRAAVKQCEEMAQFDRSNLAFLKFYRSTSGRVAKMSRLHKAQAKRYRDRLRQVKPNI